MSLGFPPSSPAAGSGQTALTAPQALLPRLIEAAWRPPGRICKAELRGADAGGEAAQPAVPRQQFLGGREGARRRSRLARRGCQVLLSARCAAAHRPASCRSCRCTCRCRTTLTRGTQPRPLLLPRPTQLRRPLSFQKSATRKNDFNSREPPSEDSPSETEESVCLQRKSCAHSCRICGCFGGSKRVPDVAGTLLQQGASDCSLEILGCHQACT